MKRVILFVVTNLAVVLVLSLVSSIFGLNRFIGPAGIEMMPLLLFSLLFGFAGSFISLWMSKWIAKKAYDIRVIEQPVNDVQRWLLQTVAEQAKLSGIPTPEVGIYESPETNAFATGPSRSNSIVAVSTGLIQNMSKREVEGVLAHEVSHVANGDMVTMTLVQGVLNTFVIFFSRIAGFFIDRVVLKNEKSVGLGYYVAVFVCEILFGLVASMVVMAFSRHREFRADADAAKIWGKEPMIAALERLRSITAQAPIYDDRSKAVSAFKINGKPSVFTQLFASHPALEERIAALKKA